MTTPLQTGVGEVVESERESERRTGEPDCAHIVRAGPGESATARVLEARVYGSPLEALCGVVFVPRRDPSRLPVCASCKDIYDTYRVFSDGLPETPPP